MKNRSAHPINNLDCINSLPSKEARDRKTSV